MANFAGESIEALGQNPQHYTFLAAAQASPTLPVIWAEGDTSPVAWRGGELGPRPSTCLEASTADDAGHPRWAQPSLPGAPRCHHGKQTPREPICLLLIKPDAEMEMKT